MAKLLNTYQAAKILEVNDSRVRQLILKGLLPATKLGRDWVIQEKDLGKVANRRKVGRPKKNSQARSSRPKRNVPDSLPVSKQSGGE